MYTKKDVHPTMSAIHANISINLVNQRDIFDIMRGFYCFLNDEIWPSYKHFCEMGSKLTYFFLSDIFFFYVFLTYFFIYMSSTCYSF